MNVKSLDDFEVIIIIQLLLSKIVFPKDPKVSATCRRFGGMYSFGASKHWKGLVFGIPWHPLALGTEERSFQNFRRGQQAHAERAKAQKEAQARRDAARDQAQAALQETGMLNDGFVLMPERSERAVETMEVETKNQEAKDDEVQEVDAGESEVPEVTAVEGVQEVDEEPEDAFEESVEDVGPF